MRANSDLVIEEMAVGGMSRFFSGWVRWWEVTVRRRGEDRVVWMMQSSRTLMRVVGEREKVVMCNACGGVSSGCGVAVVVCVMATPSVVSSIEKAGM